MATKKDGEQFVRKAMVDSIAAASALLVVHRVARALEAQDATLEALQKQQQALDNLLQYARLHPLPPEMEKHL
jgi:hypothetical protein